MLKGLNNQRLKRDYLLSLYGFALFLIIISLDTAFKGISAWLWQNIDPAINISVLGVVCACLVARIAVTKTPFEIYSGSKTWLW